MTRVNQLPSTSTIETSDDTGFVVASSPELYTEQKLVLLDGRRLRVTSALLTSTMALGS